MSGAYLIVQVALLVLVYGFKYSMPWWITWFPTLLLIIPYVFTLMILIIGALID